MKADGGEIAEPKDGDELVRFRLGLRKASRASRKAVRKAKQGERH